MKKEILALVLVSCSFALVSANAKPVIQNTDVGHYSKSNLELVVMVDGPAVPKFDVGVYDCDAYVPEICGVPLHHVESVYVLSSGYKPPAQAKARAPTSGSITEIIPRIRDKPVIAHNLFI